MTTADIIILILAILGVAGGIAYAVIRHRRLKKGEGCSGCGGCGGCGGCSYPCNRYSEEEKDKKP